MARIRTIKPEFWDSPGTARASLRARLFFIAMWNYADDWGIGDGHPLRLLSFAFPNDESSDVEPRNFRLLASEVAECFDVQWYEVDGRAFYAIPSWEEHQRTEKKAKRKNPPPDQAVSFLYGTAAENPPLNRGLASDGRGKGEVGKGSGKGEEDPSSEIADAIPRPEIDHLLDLLDSEIITNGGKPPARTKKNIDAIRLMLDRDNRTVEQIENAIRWCQADEFWRSNILSASKLREKYDQLRLAAQRVKPAVQQKQSKASQNAEEYRRLFGGDEGSIQALDSGIR